MTSSLKYKPEIDGLRALAIIPVVLFHAGAQWMSGGYVGVDIFFVISGFLITSLILSEREDGGFSFTNFYVRRARRILPALFLMLAATCIFAWLWMMPASLAEYGRTLIAVILFGSNIQLAKGVSYFGGSAETNPLLHTWSLAVEEQYYFAFPLLIWALWRFEWWKLLAMLFALALLSLGMAEYGRYQHATANFYWLSSRAWELLVGALAACWLHKRPIFATVAVRELWAVFGLCLLLLPMLTFDKETPFPGLYALLPTTGTVLLLAFASADTKVGRFLAMKPLVGIGLISYSIYLWHQPMFAFAKLAWGNLSPLAYTGLVLASVFLAWLSWHFVERPFRNPTSFSRKAVLSGLLVVGAGLLSAGYAMNSHGGYPDRFGELGRAENAYGGTGFDFGVWQTHGATAAPIAFVLYGDSHALQYMGAMTELAKEQNIAFASVTHSACVSLPGVVNLYKGSIQPDCRALLAELESHLRGTNMPLILALRWGKELADLDGRRLGKFGESEIAEKVLFTALDKFHQEIGNTRKLVLVGNVPTTNLIEQGGYVACKFRSVSECPETFPEENGELFGLRAKMRAYASSRKNIVFFDPYDALCEGGTCRVADGMKSFYSDHAHLSQQGAEQVVNWMVLKGILNGSGR